MVQSAFHHYNDIDNTANIKRKLSLWFTAVKISRQECPVCPVPGHMLSKIETGGTSFKI